MASVNERFGARLRELRTQAGVTQAELGKMVGLSRPSITNIEQGRQPVTIELLLEFAAALGVEPPALLPEVGNAQPLISDYISHLTANETEWIFDVLQTPTRREQPA